MVDVTNGADVDVRFVTFEFSLATTVNLLLKGLNQPCFDERLDDIRRSLSVFGEFHG